MTILLTLVHVFVCLFLILVVLLQTGKGADVAAAFGGSSQTAFGARGASTFLSKMTTVSAIVFMLTSLTLSLMSSSTPSSVIEKTGTSQAPVAPPAGTPATPGQMPPSQGTSGATSGAAPTAPAAPAPAPPANTGTPAQGGTPPSGGGH
jgi:preprotein translocase subunit SecG